MKKINVSSLRQYPIIILPFNLFGLIIAVSDFFLEKQHLVNNENILFNRVFIKSLFPYVKP